MRARPAWFSPYTVAEFFSTALLLGPLFARAMGVASGPEVVWAAVAGGTAQLITQTLKFLWLSQSETFELHASAQLLSGRFRPQFLTRLAILIAGGIVLPLVAHAGIFDLLLVLSGEWLGRWLFFVTVVPKNLGAAFTGAKVA